MTSRILTGAALAVSLTGLIWADGGAAHRVRNLNFGVSGGNVKDISRRFCCSGTLGSLIQASDGAQYILSNNHVMGLAGRATAGDDISQPGLIDNNCRPATIVADFSAAPLLSSNVDAAASLLRTSQMDASGSIQDIGVPSSTVKAPSIGLSVAKSGRTTGFTTGSLTSISTTVSVRYPKSCGSSGGTLYQFTNQVVVGQSGFSAGGDSGSLIVTNDSSHQPVGLLFAGSSTSTIGNPIGEVLARVGEALAKQVSFTGPAALSAQAPLSPSDTQIAAASTALREYGPQFMGRGGVIGVGVGAADDNPQEAVVVVYVERSAGVTPQLPAQARGVRVKRVLTDPFVAFGCCQACK